MTYKEIEDHFPVLWDLVLLSLKDQKRQLPHPESTLTYCSNEKGFSWSNTPQGHDFWLGLSHLSLKKALKYKGDKYRDVLKHSLFPSTPLANIRPELLLLLIETNS